MHNSSRITASLLKQTIRRSEFRPANRSFTSHVPTQHASLLTRNSAALVQIYHLQGMNIQWNSYTTAAPKTRRTKDEVATQVIEDMIRQASTKATKGSSSTSNATPSSATTTTNPTDPSQPYHANPNPHPNTRADGSHITSADDVTHSKAADKLTEKVGKFADIMTAAAKLSVAAVDKKK